MRPSTPPRSTCPTLGSSSAYQNGSMIFFKALALFLAATAPAPAAAAPFDFGIEDDALELLLCPLAVTLRFAFGCCAACPVMLLGPEVPALTLCRPPALEAVAPEAPMLRSCGGSTESRFPSLAGSDRERRMAADEIFSVADARWPAGCATASQGAAEEAGAEAKTAGAADVAAAPPRPPLVAEDVTPGVAEAFFVTRAEAVKGAAPGEVLGMPPVGAD